MGVHYHTFQKIENLFLSNNLNQNMPKIIVIGDRIFRGMQDFDFFPNLIKLLCYQIYSNFTQLSKFT